MMSKSALRLIELEEFVKEESVKEIIIENDVVYTDEYNAYYDENAMVMDEHCIILPIVFETARQILSQLGVSSVAEQCMIPEPLIFGGHKIDKYTGLELVWRNIPHLKTSIGLSIHPVDTKFTIWSPGPLKTFRDIKSLCNEVREYFI